MDYVLPTMVQVVEISLQQQLYDALIHVHNRGLHDYSTPLLELLLQLRAAVKKAGKTFSSELKEGEEEVMEGKLDKRTLLFHLR